ncbi:MULTISPECIES: hypothetical protein [unclassified Pseudomonas]|uniref:hypothetical protein n=1 Tax=unclassified Pseudomonas TaxID=196821 RepID=UPI000A1DD16F|nr:MULTISPECIES: hypothetical protein [unclassified Pseudomonas]
MTDSTPIATFRQRVASCFGKRPGLREVLSLQGFNALVDRYPFIRSNHPQLASLDDFHILQAPAGQGEPARQPLLLDALLEHLRTGKHLQLKGSDALSISPPQVFLAQEQGANSIAQPGITLDMYKVSSDLDGLLDTLTEAFQQAQISYWSGSDPLSGVSRLHWLELLIKAAMLSNVQRQGLDADATATLYAMLDGTRTGITISAMRLEFGVGWQTFERPVPDLLLSTTRGASQLLWCKPCGTIRSYPDQAAFSAALQDEMAERYHFDRLTWSRTALEGDPFAYQARQMLNVILDDIHRLSLAHVQTVSEMEDAYAHVSDPSLHFLQQPYLVEGVPTLQLPGWLAGATAEDRFEYHAALLDLAARQGHSGGATSLGDIETIEQYANRRLREQTQATYPDNAAYDPDTVLIAVSELIPNSSAENPQYLFLRHESLTSLAVARLPVNEVMTRVSAPAGSWLSIDQVHKLIHQVDIGGSYPGFLREQVEVQPRRAQRIRQYAWEWRSGLRFSVLKASISEQLSEHTRRALLNFCTGIGDSLEQPRIAPLAFRCAPGASASDRAHGMFVIELPGLHSWILYRPFYADQTLQEFTSLASLMVAIRKQGELQRSVLHWLKDEARKVYENDGFNFPHLHPKLSSLAHLLGVDAALTATLLDNLRRPVDASFEAWTENLDSHLFDARVEAILHVASTRSVSNAQERWALAKEAAWAVFNSATVFWSGLLANVAWLFAALSAAKDDLAILANGGREERIAAATDLLSNLAMLLAHRVAHATSATETPVAVRFSEPAERNTSAAQLAEPIKERPWAEPVAEAKPKPIRIDSWSANQRLANLTPDGLQALRKLQATQSLQGHTPLATGQLRGLYQVDQRYYVKLADIAFEVQQTWGGVQIIGPDESRSEWVAQWGGTDDGYHIVGRERSRGPWLTRWNDEWVLNVSGAGGMPNTEQVRSHNRQAYEQLLATTKANQTALSRLEPLMEKSRQKLQPYDDLAAAFNKAYQALPETQRSPLPKALQTQRQQLLALREHHLLDLKGVSLFLEKQATVLKENLDAFRQMLEPRFARYDRAGRIEHSFSQWTETAIDNDMLLLRRLFELPDHEQLRELARGLQKFPVGQEQLSRYAKLRKATRDALDVASRILVVSERLDQTLPLALDDNRVRYAQKKTKIEQAIELRPYSTLIVRAQTLSDMAYLTLDKSLLTPETAAELLPLQDALCDQHFSSMLWSHDGLAAANLPYSQQAEILGDALREYRAVLGKASYLQTYEEPAIDAAMLADYVAQLKALVKLTEVELNTALTGIETSAPPAVPRVTHRVRAGRRTVIHTSRGRSLLVEPGREGNQAIQRNPLTQQPAGEYEQRDGVWFEVPGQQQPAAPDRAQLRHRAARLLAQKDKRMAIAALYTEEPNSLADLMDWQIEDMREASRQLAGSSKPKDLELASELNQAVETVTLEKSRLLTNVYLNTRHPDSKALRYLSEQQRLQIARTTARKALSKPDDYLDVYQIRDVQAPQAVLWEAHFHYRSADAPARAFVKGHLKFWEPRGKARDAQMEEASSAAERLQIYRSDLRLAQVEGVIPFPSR